MYYFLVDCRYSEHNSERRQRPIALLFPLWLAMARFDDRPGPRGKDGDDFQRFVWEVLRSGHFESILGKRYIRPYLASGNDGAIDHLGIGTQDQVVFESKFFGKERKGEPSSDWTKLATTLGLNLRANAGRSYENVDRLYKPWFEIDRPIKAYWFCTSGDFSPGAQAELRQRIKDFFSDLGRESTLAHLATIDVEVLGWNDFVGVLAANPPLHFRWFRTLPVGLRPLRSITEGKTFRKFLEERALGFFSREVFNREIGFDNEARLKDEQAILSPLLEGSERLGLILSGPGGVGKTRLALQLGLDAERVNWLVLQVDRTTIKEAIEELAREYASRAHVLLVIDYAEAARSLFSLAQEMERANRDGGHRFRFIATCRASALSAVKEALEESVCEILEFSDKPDDRYATWVVDKILACGAIPHATDIALVCAGLPVLAAFAVFLFEQHPEDFDAQFGQIHRGDDFAAWADKRLRLALQARGLEDRSTRRTLASIAAHLPLSAEEYYDLRRLNDEAARLLDILLADRWIEFDGERATAAHDIFADAIVARYVFEAPGTVTDRVGDVFDDALDAGAFDRALIAVNRLTAHKWFVKIDGLQSIRRAYARRPESVIAARELLLKTELPDYRTCIRILAELPDVAGAVAADMSCDGRLSYLAESVAESRDAEWRDEAASILHSFLDRAVERDQPSNMVVRRSFRLIPTRYRDDALAWIRREPTRLETHFLLVAWLRADLPLEDISADVETWLVGGAATHFKASFVYRAWLEAAAKLEKAECAAKIAKVEPFVLAWLGDEKHRFAEDAQFVYKSWLDAAAKLDKTECAAKFAKIEPFVLGWLDKHCSIEEAKFVYSTWFAAAAKFDKAECAAKIAQIEPLALAWLARHGSAEGAGFVYPPWLNAAAELDKAECTAKIAEVEPFVFAWLDGDKHRTAENTQFFYKAWLDAAAKLDDTERAAKIAKVEPFVFAWLDKHGSAETAQFVYPAWLDAAAKFDNAECAAKITKVGPFILAWLDKHGSEDGAQFVYKSWLDAGGSPDCIRGPMISWLNANLSSQTSDFIIKSWLAATHDFVAVRIPALLWLKRNAKNQDSVFVLKFICKDREIPQDAIEDVISWCTNFPDNFDAICRIGPIFSRFATGPLERPLTDAALLCLEKIHPEALADKGVRDAALATIGALAWKSRSLDETKSRLDPIHANILLNSPAYLPQFAADAPSFVLNPELAQHVARMISRGVMVPERAMDALARFADWLAAWPPDKREKLRPAIRSLERVCPIPALWSRVGFVEDTRTIETSLSNRSDLNQLLEQLNDKQLPPHEWSKLWEKGWKEFTGDPQLVAVARNWLNDAATDPSWPYVWEPLFLYFPEDSQFVDIALRWLEFRGPRHRGAWTYVWNML